MSKYLDMLTKDYKVVQSRLDRLLEELDDLQNLNIPKLQELIGAGVDEISLEIAKLIDKGRPGKDYKDFAGEKTVKAAYAGAESLVKDLQKAYDAEAKAIRLLEAELVKLDSLIKETEKDLKKRDFKAKFGIDSKSQALIDKTQKDMEAKYTATEKSLREIKDAVRKGTAKAFLESQMKTVMSGLDFNKKKAVKEMYARLVDVRVVNKYMGEVKKSYEVVIANLDEAAAAIKGGNGKIASAAFKAAGESMKALKKGAAFLSDGLEAHVKGGGAKPTDKEMKPLFQAVDTCGKLVKAAEDKGKAVAKDLKAVA